MFNRLQDRQLKLVLKFAGVYLLFGFGWLLFGKDTLYPLFFKSMEVPWIRLGRDFIFVLGTGLIFFTLLYKFIEETSHCQAEVEQKTRRLEALFDNLPGMAYRYLGNQEERDWELEFVSSEAKELTGYTVDELLADDGDFYKQCIHPEEQEEVLTTVRKALRNHENYVVEYRIKRKDGQVKWVEDRGQGIYDESGELIAVEGIIEEITEIKNARRSVELARNEAEYLAHHDSLTGLPSRGYFLEEATDWLRSSKEGSGTQHFLFCIVDVINFQKFNNFYGYWLGNRILEETARWLKQKLPEEFLIGRLGGDEFGVFFPVDEIKEDLESTVKELLEPLQNSFELEDEEITYHMRVGVAAYPEDGRGLEELLAAANSAVNREDGGLDQQKILIYEDADYKDLKMRVKSSEKLLGALDEDRLELFYQPIVDSRDNSNFMLEALLRINTPDGDRRSLKNYSEVMYDSQLTERLDTWVMNKIVEETEARVNAGEAPFISLNLFPASFLKESIFEELDRVVAKADFPREKLVIEVTEKLLGTHSEQAVGNLVTATKDYGFRIALDDFGVGHGSFQTLQDLSLDFLKIDGSFILDLDDNEMSRNFVRSLADLGQRIEVPVVGEWVETAETANRLMDMGIYYHQGYHYKRPQKLEEVLES